MKNLWIILVFLVFFSPLVLALKNPASVYCENLGFQYVRETNADNSVSNFCIINETKYPAWDFYSGKVAKEFSYCAQRGYNIISVENGKFSPISGACINKSVKLTRDITSKDYILQEDIMNLESFLQESKPEVQINSKSDLIENTIDISGETKKNSKGSSSSSNSKSHSTNTKTGNFINEAITRTEQNLIRLNPLHLLAKTSNSGNNFFLILIMPISLLLIIIIRRKL